MEGRTRGEREGGIKIRPEKMQAMKSNFFSFFFFIFNSFVQAIKIQAYFEGETAVIVLCVLSAAYHSTL